MKSNHSYLGSTQRIRSARFRREATASFNRPILNGIPGVVRAGDVFKPRVPVSNVNAMAGVYRIQVIPPVR